MRTHKIKLTQSGGYYSPTHPAAQAGSANMTYAITGVPDDVPLAGVIRQITKVTLAHSFCDESGWTYDWSELAGKPQGHLINRYTRRAS